MMTQHVRAVGVECLLDLLENLGIKTAGVEYMDEHNGTELDGYLEPFLARMGKK